MFSGSPNQEAVAIFVFTTMANFDIKYIQYCGNVILVMLRPCIYATANIIINIYLRIDKNILMNVATIQKTYRVLKKTEPEPPGGRKWKLGENPAPRALALTTLH